MKGGLRSTPENLLLFIILLGSHVEFPMMTTEPIQKSGAWGRQTLLLRNYLRLTESQ
jgi:hypothetical protein